MFQAVSGRAVPLGAVPGVLRRARLQLLQLVAQLVGEHVVPRAGPLPPLDERRARHPGPRTPGGHFHLNVSTFEGQQRLKLSVASTGTLCGGWCGEAAPVHYEVDDVAITGALCGG